MTQQVSHKISDLAGMLIHFSVGKEVLYVEMEKHMKGIDTVSPRLKKHFNLP
jgi:hypothetical protein